MTVNQSHHGECKGHYGVQSAVTGYKAQNAMKADSTETWPSKSVQLSVLVGVCCVNDSSDSIFNSNDHAVMSI